MKESTVHSLIIARTLLERAEPLCASDDRYLASAGLVVLQDALETVFYALLIEKGVDDEKNLERKGFDELVGELKAAGVTLPKSGTLKALNKQRVLTKHYAQVAEPVTVRTYFDAARVAIDAAMNSVAGHSLSDLFIADLLKDGEAKQFLNAAEGAIRTGRFLDALTETRKAIFVEFEQQYSIHGWRNYEGAQEGLLASAIRGGWRAPYWTRTKDWIDKNVHVPSDYIQIDHQDWRMQAMELGIHTGELQNLQRLTPGVFRIDQKAQWSVTYDAAFPANNATQANARYCLDRAVSIVLKKQEHAGIRREAAKDQPFDPPTIYIGRVVYERPDTRSKQLHVVAEGFSYTIHRIVGGFDPALTFYEISAESEERSKESLLDLPTTYFRGFLEIVRDEDKLLEGDYG
jgi:hypothetical protein